MRHLHFSVGSRFSKSYLHLKLKAHCSWDAKFCIIVEMQLYQKQSRLIVEILSELLSRVRSPVVLLTAISMVSSRCKQTVDTGEGVE